MDNKTKFAKYLIRKHLEYQMEQGRSVPAKDFAYVIGVSPTTYSSWVNGGYNPSMENLLLLERIFGVEIYDALELPRPAAKISIVHLPKHMQEHLIAMITVMESELDGLDAESPEAHKIADSVAERFGYKVPAAAQDA